MYTVIPGISILHINFSILFPVIQFKKQNSQDNLLTFSL